MRISFLKSLLLAAFIIPAASTAGHAAACDTLANSRYVIVLEGTFVRIPNSIVTLFIDKEHHAYKYLGQIPTAATLPANGQGLYGKAYIDTVSCQADTANPLLAQLNFNSGGAMTIKLLSSDGSSFSAQGIEGNSLGMSGYGYRVK